MSMYRMRRRLPRGIEFCFFLFCQVVGDEVIAPTLKRKLYMERLEVQGF